MRVAAISMAYFKVLYLRRILQILQLLISDFTKLVFQLGELQLQRRDSNGLEFSRLQQPPSSHTGLSNRETVHAVEVENRCSEYVLSNRNRLLQPESVGQIESQDRFYTRLIKSKSIYRSSWKSTTGIKASQNRKVKPTSTRLNRTLARPQNSDIQHPTRPVSTFSLFSSNFSYLASFADQWIVHMNKFCKLASFSTKNTHLPLSVRILDALRTMHNLSVGGRIAWIIFRTSVGEK